MADLEGLFKSLGRRGAMKILDALAAHQELNFNKLVRIVVHSPRTDRAVKALLKYGLVKKRKTEDKLGTVMYSLTEKGSKLTKILEQCKKLE